MGKNLDYEKLKGRIIELEKKEEYYRLIAEHSTDMISKHDINAVFLYVSPVCTKILGYSPDELVNRSAHDFHHPEDLKKILNSNITIKKMPVTDTIAYRFKHKKGHYVWVETTSKTIRDSNTDEIKEIICTTRDITERKQAEESLSLARSIIDRANIGIYFISSEGKIEEVNWKAAELLGYSREELETLFIADIDPKASLESWSAHWKKLNAVGARIIEREHRKKDGSLISVEILSNVLKYKGGLYAVAFVQDITERKQAEELLRQKQTQLSEAMKMANAGHWEYDVASDTFTFNDHLYRIFRTTVEEVGGYHMSSAEAIRRFSHPDEVNIVTEAVQAAIEAPDSKYRPLFEHRILYADGEVGYITVRLFVVKNDQGKTIRVFGVNQDITERKKAEESRRFTQFAIDNTVDQAFWTTADGHFVYVNKAACCTLGYSREELMRLSVFDIGPTFSPETFAEHWQGLKTNPNASFETFHRAKDGRVYPVEVRSNYVVFDGKEYNCAFATDISERKRMESEREALIKKLQKALAEIKELKGILPICSSCKKIRDDKGYWTQIESYIHKHSNAEFSHAICPDCMKKMYPEYDNDEDLNG